jgi:ferritin
MISKTMQDSLNQQLNRELYSHYIYLAMSAHLESRYLKGMARWMRLQAEEELGHAMKFFDYLQERGATPNLTLIEQPPKEWASPLAVFEAALAHEQLITKSINTLVDVAAGEKDHATGNFLQWFVTEQVEEEANLDPIIYRLKLSGENVAALYALDRELEMRAAK